MQDKLNNIKHQFNTDLELTKISGDYDSLYLKYFSKTNGITTLFAKELPKLSADDKKTYGILINELITDQKELIEQDKKDYIQKLEQSPLIDLSIPHKPKTNGYLHPLTQVTRQMNKFFRYYGFSVYDGPEIETALYNFRKLNLPQGHPATDLQDTLFIKTLDGDADILLRTHTSSVEARLLTDYEPPIRVVVPGKVFRNETASATNTAFFHHYQGVVVDKGITIQNLMHTLERFHKFLYGEDTEVRFRYKYYPEVSPGVGVDMKCRFCSGDGCEVCKMRGWIEVLGSGMIHYNTLKMCGIDPEVYTGYAFGMGLDRLVMQKFGITDIRHMFGGGMIYK